MATGRLSPGYQASRKEITKEKYERKERENKEKKNIEVMEKPNEVAGAEKAKERFFMNSEVDDCDMSEDEEGDFVMEE